MDAGTRPQTPALSSAFYEQLIAILGPDHVHAAGPADKIFAVQPQLILEPATEQRLAQVLRLANETGLAVIPRGGGTKLAWGNPPTRADLIVSTRRMDRVLEHAWADLTVTVEAGCTIQKLQQTLAQHNQRLALDALWPEHATVGGVLSTNDSGALRLRFGSLRDLIIGVTQALADGTLASSGGKVVKNVAGYDLPKLATGAFGTLGVITRAVFRLHPLPHATRTISCIARDAAEAQRLMLAVQDSQLAHSALQIRFLANNPPQLDVLFEATQAGLAAQTEKLESILSPLAATEADPSVWNTRQELFSAACNDESGTVGVAKISILPAQLAKTFEAISRLTSSQQLRSNAVFQATGLGTLLLYGQPSALFSALQSLRAEVERAGGSLVALHLPSATPPFDAWGTASDALPLMKAVKYQLDPQNTLNPGRFLGSI